MKIEDFKDELFFEMAGLILGEKLGNGYARTVYEYGLNGDYVVKIAEGAAGVRCNILEEHIWGQVQYMDLAKWFAPVKRISENGRMLVMEKATFPDADKYPDKIPHFFTDIKYENYGFIGNQFVSVDYAGLILTAGVTNKMKKAKWKEWGEVA